MSKRIQILAALFVAQLVVAVLVLTLPSQAAPEAARPLLESITEEDITALTVREQPDKQIRLVKKDGQWVLPEVDDYPADASRVTSFLEKIVAVTVGRPIASTAASHARLQVGDDSFNRKVELSTTKGERALFFGSARGSSTNVRLAGSDDVFLTTKIAIFDISADTSNWINTLFFTSTQQEIGTVAIRTVTETLVFKRDLADAWRLDGLKAGETFNPARLETILSRVASLNMVRPLGKQDKPEYGMAQPSAILTLTLKSDVSGLAPLVLRVGARDPQDSTFVVKASNSPWYVRVNAFVLEEVVNAKREDFLQVPTPTPVVTPTEAAATPVPVQVTPTPTPVATPTEVAATPTPVQVTPTATPTR